MWVIFGLLAAVFRASFVLFQEKINMEPVTLAIWSKICCVLFIIPLVIYYGMPTDPLFYLFTILSGIIWSIGDVIMWKTIPVIGSGVFTRTLPISVILNFILWFAVDPSIIGKYINQPIISGLIFLTLGLSCYFAMRMKKCHVTRTALKQMWFVILSFVVGPMMAMLASKYAVPDKGAWGFVFFEAMVMLFLWMNYIFIKSPIKFNTIISKQNLKYGLIAGFLMASMVITYIYGMYHSDNPGYILALISLEAVIVSIVNRLRGKKDDSDIMAGLGIVACAIALILLKTQIQ